MKSAALFLMMITASLTAAEPLQQDLVRELRPRLNSDRIAYFFGSYGVDTLNIESWAFPDSRIANLYSLHNGRKVMRTLAVVDFAEPVHPELLEVHDAVAAGKSIGIALRDEGWTIEKTPIYFGVLELSANVMRWMDEQEVSKGAVHIYRLNANRGRESIPYCAIMEVHSPQYLSPEWLHALYPEQYEVFSCCTTETSPLLFRLSKLMAEFPAP